MIEAQVFVASCEIICEAGDEVIVVNGMVVGARSKSKPKVELKTECQPPKHLPTLEKVLKIFEQYKTPMTTRIISNNLGYTDEDRVYRKQVHDIVYKLFNVGTLKVHPSNNKRRHYYVLA